MSFGITDTHVEYPQDYPLGTPGSDKAIGHGCTCAVMDNHYGAGFLYKGQEAFYITGGCVVHDASDGPILESLRSVYQDISSYRFVIDAACNDPEFWRSIVLVALGPGGIHDQCIRTVETARDTVVALDTNNDLWYDLIEVGFELQGPILDSLRDFLRFDSEGKYATGVPDELSAARKRLEVILDEVNALIVPVTRTSVIALKQSAVTSVAQDWLEFISN